jgi:non-ribosomal peptide synthetase component F
VNVYGPAECTIESSHFLCPENLDEYTTSLPIGRPIAGVVAHVLDAQMHPVLPGQTGELFIGGRGVMHGYLKRPDLTEKAIVVDSVRGRLYRTGDLVRVLVSGELRFEGRVDHQVKLRGQRLEVEEVESSLLSVRESISDSPLLSGAAVALLKHPVSHDDVLVAFCVSASTSVSIVMVSLD